MLSTQSIRDHKHIWGRKVVGRCKKWVCINCNKIWFETTNAPPKEDRKPVSLHKYVNEFGVMVMEMREK